MIPEGRLSTTPQISPFNAPRNLPFNDLLSYSIGGIALRDSSQGIQVKNWHCYANALGQVFIGADDVPDTLQFTRLGILNLSMTFDQNMNPFVAFVVGDQATYWWYDTLVAAQVFTDLETGATSPKCIMDDPRGTSNATSDIILAYVHSNTLYYRQQRERYLNRHVLMNNVSNILPFAHSWNIGMNRGNRLQIQLRGNFFGL